MAEITYAQHAERASMDKEAQEGLTYYDKLNKLLAEEQLGPGFQLVDRNADPAETPVEAGEDAGLRAMADTLLEAGSVACWESGTTLAVAAEQAAERIAAGDPYADVDVA